jgi:hypothetical protein
MGVPLMIQDKDNQLIEQLKKDCGIHKKIDVIRAGLILLQKEVARTKKAKRWKQAAQLVSKNSGETNKAFQRHSRIKRIDTDS